MDRKKTSAPDAPQKNTSLTLSVTGISNRGFGIGHAPDGRVVFVNGTVPGDVAEVKIIKVTSSYLVGRLEKLLTRSEKRSDEPFCDAATACGGCVYRELDYVEELRLKHDDVCAAFKKAGLPDVVIGEVRTTEQTKGYRNKGQYPVSTGADGLIAGFYAAKSHRVVGAAHCALQPAIFGEIVAFICDFCKKHSIPAYDEVSGKGLLRHIYLRTSSPAAGSRVLVCLVICGKTFPAADEMVRELTGRFPTVCGILLNHNEENTNVVLGERYTPLWGETRLTDILCGLTLKIDPAAFYQVNHDATELLYGLAAERAGLSGKESVLDLYCGIGSIGLSMANRAGAVFGIEIVPEAVACAEENAHANGITNAHFACGDASDAAKLLDNAERLYGPLHPDVVILDPPRKGTTPELIDMLSGRGIPKIVYISCDYVTLARDCALFRERGYTIGEVTPVDLFPRTGHVETVVLLSKGVVDKDNSRKVKVDFSLEDLDLTELRGKATYAQVKEYILNEFELKVSSLYIAQVKKKCGIETGENHNLPKSEGAKGPVDLCSARTEVETKTARQPQVTPEKEEAIMKAFRHFGVI